MRLNRVQKSRVWKNNDEKPNVHDMKKKCGGYLECMQQPRKIAQKKECAKLKGESWQEGSWKKNTERDFMWISKYQQKKICRKRTTADRQNWGKRISFSLRSSRIRVVVIALHRLRSSRVGISYICGGLAFTVIL